MTPKLELLPCRRKHGPLGLHDRCHLDLRRLKERTRQVEELRAASLAWLAELEARALALGVTSRYSCLMRSAVEPVCFTLYNASLAQAIEFTRLTKEVRLLYATRAHHRGKVHETAHRTGGVSQKSGAAKGRRPNRMQTLEGQAREVAETWVRFARRPEIVR